LARDDDRSANLALGGNGTASGDGVCGVLLLVNIAGYADARFDGDIGDGDRGDFGDGLGDFVTSRNLDGERDRERRRDLTAEVTSTWCTCVGDGIVRVPPPLLEYDMVNVLVGMWRLDACK
jgi:hypothetical protein